MKKRKRKENETDYLQSKKKMRKKGSMEGFRIAEHFIKKKIHFSSNEG